MFSGDWGHEIQSDRDRIRGRFSVRRFGRKRRGLHGHLPYNREIERHAISAGGRRERSGLWPGRARIGQWDHMPVRRFVSACDAADRNTSGMPTAQSHGDIQRRQQRNLDSRCSDVHGNGLPANRSLPERGRPHDVPICRDRIRSRSFGIADGGTCAQQYRQRHDVRPHLRHVRKGQSAQRHLHGADANLSDERDGKRTVCRQHKRPELHGLQRQYLESYQDQWRAFQRPALVAARHDKLPDFRDPGIPVRVFARTGLDLDCSLHRRMDKFVPQRRAVPVSSCKSIVQRQPRLPWELLDYMLRHIVRILASTPNEFEARETQPRASECAVTTKGRHSPSFFLSPCMITNVAMSQALRRPMTRSATRATASVSKLVSPPPRHISDAVAIAA